jgi:predicted ATPase
VSSGKSALIEAIAIRAGFNPEGGTKNFRTGIKQTRYEETEHYAVTRAFLQDPAGRLRKLFAELDDDD